jgi:MFS family permease
MLEAIAGFSLYLFGIAFAPIYTPHLSERYGRSPVYMVALPMWMLFVLGTGFAQNFATVAICRFFAGLVGGPCLVLIEGTFADVWSASLTGTYYSFLTLASYVGAACGMTS